MQRITRASRGDTIIEVLLAITIFSMVAVGALTLMNQGTSSAQRALEITQVRQQIDSQAEMLRAVHQAYTADSDEAKTVWDSMTAKADSASFAPDNSCPSELSQISGAFIMNTTNATMLDDSDNWFAAISSATAPPYAQFVSDEGKAYGLWIETTRESAIDDRAPDAYDFRIRACWFGAGLNANTPMRLETLVRLYEP